MKSARFMKLPVIVLISLLALAALVFTACPDAGSSDGGGGGYRDPYAGLPQETFYAQNVKTEAYYTVNAVRLRRGSVCEVWADRNANISTDTAAAIVKEFEDRINWLIVDVFGGYKKVNNNTGRLILLLLDIQDGYSGSGGYVAGYFNAGDLFMRDAYNPYSNELAMLYIDTNPGMSNLPACYETIAHELQHLINFNNSVVYRWPSGGSITPQDLWINEGLSSAAEYIYWRGQHTNGRVEDFNASATIRQGNNFFVWGENPANILDEYATVYLFFQWLRVHGSETIYKAIGQRPEDTYKAVIKAVNIYFSSSSLPPDWSGATEEKKWEVLLRSWFAANYLKNNTGLYGYKADGLNTSIQVKDATGGTTIQLWPGEGVYSTITGTKSLSNAENISYAGLASGTVSTGGSYTGKLLTFNKQAVSDWDAPGDDYSKSPGTLASSVVSVPPSPSLNTRQAAAKPRSYPVSPGDLTGRGRVKTIPLGDMGAGDE
jgi:hypothetical protein